MQMFKVVWRMLEKADLDYGILKKVLAFILIVFISVVGVIGGAIGFDWTIRGIIWVHKNTCIPLGWVLLGILILAALTGLGFLLRIWFRKFHNSYSIVKKGLETEQYLDDAFVSRGFKRGRIGRYVEDIRVRGCRYYENDTFIVYVKEIYRVKAKLFVSLNDGKHGFHWVGVINDSQTLQIIEALADPSLLPTCLGLSDGFDKFIEYWLQKGE